MSIYFRQIDNLFEIIDIPETLVLNVGDYLVYYENIMLVEKAEPSQEDHVLFRYISPNIYDFKNNTILFKNYDKYFLFNGLFKIIKLGVTIKNLKIMVENNDINITGFLLTDRTKSELSPITIDNCSLIFNLTNDEKSYSGLIGNYFTGTINNCVMDYKEGSKIPNLVRLYSGWIVGDYAGIDSQLTIENCSSNGVLAANDCGGIVGSHCANPISYNALCTIRNCNTSGSLNATNYEAERCGGICGSYLGYSSLSSDATVLVENCVSDINFINELVAISFGGICGYFVCGGQIFRKSICTINNCIFTGKVIAKSWGGICAPGAGVAYNKGISILNINNCHSLNENSVYDVDATSSNAYSGGICASYTGACIDATHYETTDSTQSIINISNCTSTGIFLSHTGGICGGYTGTSIYQTGNENSSPAISTVTITDCYCYGRLVGKNAGGICGTYTGYAYSTTGSPMAISEVNINNCFLSGQIFGENAGGICGYRTARSLGVNTECNVRINNCFSIGEISGIGAGGICGSYIGTELLSATNSNIEINCCYSVGKITGQDAGGIVGKVPNKGTITDSYCLDWDGIELVNDFGRGNIVGSEPLGTFTITNCSFNDGNIIYGSFTPVTLETLLTNSSCYLERRCISSGFTSTAPFLNVFNNNDIWEKTENCLTNFSPKIIKSYCSMEIYNNVIWPDTYINMTTKGSCTIDSKNSSSNLNRQCLPNAQWKETEVKCKKQSKTVLHQIITLICLCCIFVFMLIFLYYKNK